MQERTDTFERYDAWILAAVLHSSDGNTPVTLSRLIGTADGLNKAVICRSELELGIGRLVRSGYLQVVGQDFTPTASALGLATVAGPTIDSIAKAIGAKAWSPQSRIPKTTDENYVTADAYAKAEKKYRKEFWKSYRSLARDK